MRVPLSWLREFIQIDLRPEDVASGLTMLGLEVEAIEPDGDDIIFDISITPNRPDCLSVSGIAREVAVACKKAFSLPPVSNPSVSHQTSTFKVFIEEPQLCPRYTGRIIKNLKVADSPAWLRRRLEQCGMRSINNVVDITNYIMLGYGHPLHAFDLDTLKGNTIRVALSGSGKKIKTLDGVERELPEETLLIWDAQRPVAIAGIMGGLETEVRPQTRNIFLEGAFFAPVSIRRSSKRLGLRTESSYRFERGTDPEGLSECADRAVEMILDICGGELTELIDEYPLRYVSSDIILRSERIKKIIGEEIPDEEVAEILRLLGFEFRLEGNTFIVRSLSRRPDVKAEIDLIEEIARVRGYDRIPSIMPEVRLSIEVNRRLKDIEFLRSALRARGFSEAINLSFMDIDKLKLLGLQEGDERLEAVEIKNPLRKEEAFLRTNLTISLLENLDRNIRYGIKDVRLFEISRVFIKTEGGHQPFERPPDERLHLGIILWHDPRPVLWKDKINPYYLLREILDGILKDFRIKDRGFRPSEEPFLHPGQSADIYILLDGKEKKIGYAGIVSQRFIDSLDIRTSQAVAILELDLESLLSVKGPQETYKPVPRFPGIERDIAIVIDSNIPAQALKELILEYPSEFIEHVTFFDYFRGGNIPPDKKSIGIRILYRAKDRTLTEDEIEVIHRSLIDHIIDKTGGIIRS